MTRPREPIHRHDCDRPGMTSSRVGSWWVDRCPTCRCVGIRRADEDTPSG
jgi:hypothetical protein